MIDPTYATRHVLKPGLLFKGKAPIITALDLELTERCNNSCVHCYINQPETDKQAINAELTTEKWKDILQQAAELGTLSVRFTGGEPLLRKDFEEIYLYTRKLGIKVILFTNARLITPTLVDMFAKIPPLKKIEVSVYGMRSDSYEKTSCTPGSFAEFQRGISLLLEKQIPFIVKSVLLPFNKGEIEEFESWSATIPWMSRTPSSTVFLDLRTRRDSAKKNRLIRSLRSSPQEGLSYLSRDSKVYIREMANYCQNVLYLHGDKLFNCGAGEKPCVDAYGMLQMCMLLRHPDCVYDLKQGNLREGVTEYFPRFQGMRATNPEYLRRCASCFIKGICEQCPAKSWAEHGTLDTPVEYLCEAAHEQARFLGLLIGGEYAWEITKWKERIDILREKSGIVMEEPPLSSSSM